MGGADDLPREDGRGAAGVREAGERGRLVALDDKATRAGGGGAIVGRTMEGGEIPEGPGPLSAPLAPIPEGGEGGQ